MATREQLFKYDLLHKLNVHAQDIEKLKDYSIYKFYVDIQGNQWFLYKPKTDMTNAYAGGQLWVRLYDYPFAYPFSTQVRSDNIILQSFIQNSVITKTNELQNNIVDFEISNNFVLVRTLSDVIVFNISQSYEITEIEGLSNKQIDVNVCGRYLTNANQKIVGHVMLNNVYHLYYHDGSNKLYDKRVSTLEEGTQLSNKIFADGIITLKIDSTDITPLKDAVFDISLSSDSINIAYEIPGQSTM